MTAETSASEEMDMPEIADRAYRLRKLNEIACEAARMGQYDEAVKALEQAQREASIADLSETPRIMFVSSAPEAPADPLASARFAVATRLIYIATYFAVNRILNPGFDFWIAIGIFVAMALIIDCVDEAE